jgi:hypothetical protein
MKENEPDLEKYLEDIATIKDMLFRADNKPIYETWSFYVWGSVIALASVIHYLVERTLGLNLERLFLEIWLPAILLLGLTEVISLTRNMSKQALPLFSRTLVRFYLSLIGCFSVLILLLLLLIRLEAVDYLPLVFLLTGSVFYFVFAQTTYTHMYIHGYLFIVLAVVLYLFHVPHQLLVPVVGCTVGASQVIVGITTACAAKKIR